MANTKQQAVKYVVGKGSDFIDSLGLTLRHAGDNEYNLYKNLDEDPIGWLHASPAGRGQLYADDAFLNKEYRGMGLGQAMYDAVGDRSKKKMVPSDYLSEDSARMWADRDPDALQQMLDDGMFDERVKPIVEAALSAKKVRDVTEPWGMLSDVPQAVQDYGQSVSGVHYSRAEEPLRRLSGDSYGTGTKGAEAGRLIGQDDIRPRTYMYMEDGSTIPQPEPMVRAGQTFEIMEGGMYDIRKNPMGFKGSATDIERQIKDAGFTGYFDTNTGFALTLQPSTEASRIGGYMHEAAQGRKLLESMNDPWTVTAENVPSKDTEFGKWLLGKPLDVRERYSDQVENLLDKSGFNKAVGGDQVLRPGYGAYEGMINPNTLITVPDEATAKAVSDARGSVLRQDAVPYLQNGNMFSGTRITTDRTINPAQMQQAFDTIGADFTRTAPNQLDFVDFEGTGTLDEKVRAFAEGRAGVTGIDKLGINSEYNMTDGLWDKVKPEFGYTRRLLDEFNDKFRSKYAVGAGGALGLGMLSPSEQAYADEMNRLTSVPDNASLLPPEFQMIQEATASLKPGETVQVGNNLFEGTDSGARIVPTANSDVPARYRLEAGLSGALEPFFTNKHSATDVGKGLTFLADLAPVTGFGMAGVDAYDAAKRGDRAGYWLNAASMGAEMLPFAGMFLGPGARNAPREAMDLAERIARTIGDVSPETSVRQQWKQTGRTYGQPAFVGADGNPRWEISDKNARLLRDPSQPWEGTLGQILDHPELYDNYANLRSMPVTLFDGAPDEGGWYDSANRAIGINFNRPDSALSSLLHEGNHAVAHNDQLGGGASGKTAWEKAQAALYHNRGVPEDQPYLDNTTMIDFINSGRGGALRKHVAYMTNSEETLARATQNRHLLSPEGRLARDPTMDMNLPAWIVDKNAKDEEMKRIPLAGQWVDPRYSGKSWQQDLTPPDAYSGGVGSNSPRKAEIGRLHDSTSTVIPRGDLKPYNPINLEDYIGRPYMTTFYDRAWSGTLTHMNGVELRSPVTLDAGFDYMRGIEPGNVTASSGQVPEQMAMMARYLKSKYGVDPLYIPHGMSPSGSDFNSMQPAAMVEYAAANMNPSTFMKMADEVESALGINIGSPAYKDQLKALGGDNRKALQRIVDRYRNKGGASVGEARLATQDPFQINDDYSYAPALSAGVLHPHKDISPSNHSTYEWNVGGDYEGTFNNRFSVMALDPSRLKALAEGGPGIMTARGVDLSNITPQDIRALQMQPAGGVLTEENVMRALEHANGRFEVGILDK